MGLFRKSKNPSEILSEGREHYVKGELKKAFTTLHGLAKKGNPEACFYIGKIYLEWDEKGLAKSFLITAAKDVNYDAAALLANEFGIRDYLSQAPEIIDTEVTAEEAFNKGFTAYQGHSDAKKEVEELTAEFNLVSPVQVDNEPISAQTSKTDDELTDEEKYEKGMELFAAKDYDRAFALLRQTCPTFSSRKNKYPNGQAAMGWMYEH